MQSGDREKELLEFYQNHSFEDRKDNLAAVKKRIGPEGFARKRKTAAARKARRCYSFAAVCMCLCIGLWSGYRWLLVSDFTRSYNLLPEQAMSNPAPNVWQYIHFQSPAFITVLAVILIALAASAALFLALGFINHRKAKK